MDKMTLLLPYLWASTPKASGYNRTHSDLDSEFEEESARIVPSRPLLTKDELTIAPFVETSYAKSAQTLNEIVNRLRECGTEHILQLPKIAVIGNQSAGKSSLVEAISKVKVPRSMGTCTRCPMEVNLVSSKDSEEWQCNISLRFGRDEQALAFGVEIGTIPFCSTNRKDEVELCLRRAQLAILNPSTDFESFAFMTREDCDRYPLKRKFSNDTIVVEVIDGDVDLTFIDLPGIISNAPVFSSLVAR
jgi:vacuolar protein sorting-associated protein 1